MVYAVVCRRLRRAASKTVYAWRALVGRSAVTAMRAPVPSGPSVRAQIHVCNEYTPSVLHCVLQSLSATCSRLPILLCVLQSLSATCAHLPYYTGFALAGTCFIFDITI